MFGKRLNSVCVSVKSRNFKFRNRFGIHWMDIFKSCRMLSLMRICLFISAGIHEMILRVLSRLGLIIVLSADWPLVLKFCSRAEVLGLWYPGRIKWVRLIATSAKGNVGRCRICALI